MEKNNILLIGNGFDLAHKLPTKYNNFLDFIKYIDRFYTVDKKKLQIVIENLKLNYMETLLKNTNLQDDCYKEIYKISEENIWIQHFLRNKDNFGDNWIDFESEISKIIKILDLFKRKNENKIDVNESNIKNSINKYITACDNFLKLFKKGTVYTNNFVDSTAKEVIKKLNDDLIDLIRCLEFYLNNIINKIEINENDKLPDIKDNNFSYILSFNYTNTFERAYSNNNQTYNYDYIHGKAQENNNMVLGIDEYLTKNEKDNNLEFVEFKKYFQRIYKKTGCEYKKWLQHKNFSADTEENSKYCLYIYGHSLDVTDKDILRDLILNEKIKQTIIFYYSDDDFKQKITNIIKLIGQDELTNRTYGKHPNIIFEKTKSK